MKKGITTTITASVIATLIAGLGGLAIVGVNTKDIRVNAKETKEVSERSIRNEVTLQAIKENVGEIKDDLTGIKGSMAEVLEISRVMAYPFVDTVAQPAE